jgi:hypothetical protein
MAFLGKIRGMLGSGSELEQQEEPVRARTFSASQFRDQELARAAEARARLEAMQIDAAAVLSPTINPVAETLMADAQQVENGERAPLVAPPPPAAAAMPWEEAAGWLSQRSAETRNFVGQYWNWDYDLRVLHFLAQQPDLDAGVAAHIFWLTAACEDYFPFGDDQPDSEVSQQIAWLTDFLGRRFAEGAFLSDSYGFDDSWDCERLKERLADLHGEGRLEWSPESLPTSSQSELMSFDDIPQEEREEVTQFLAGFGVY